MAQTGYTPILIYGSSTVGNIPSASNLTNSTLGSELAINITDGKLFYKDNSGSVQVIAWKITPASAGGTGQSSYAVGDILYASTTTQLSKLSDVATGNALISGGVGVAPSWGKIDLTTHVTGTLPIANGGTNQTAFTGKSGNICGLVFFDGTSFQNDSTVSHVGYDTVANTFYCQNEIVGDGTTASGITVNSVGSSGNGPLFTLQKAGTTMAYIGAYSAIHSGTSSDLEFWAASGNGQQWRVNGGSTAAMKLNTSGQLAISGATAFGYLNVLGDGAYGASFVQSTNTNHGISAYSTETVNINFELNGGASQDISSIDPGSVWSAIFIGSWANNYQGGGLTPPADYYHVTSTNNTIYCGSTNVTVSRNASTGKLQVTNTNGTYSPHFSGRVIINYHANNKLPAFATFLSLGLQTCGSVQPYDDNTYTLGDASNRWTTVYATTGTINTSDGTQKTIIGSLEQAEIEAAKSIKAIIKKFRWNDAVAKKGDRARIHVGVIAQEVAEVFRVVGLNPNDYGLFCSDTWMELNGQPIQPDEKGEYPSDAKQVTQLGIRYEELLAFVLAGL